MDDRTCPDCGRNPALGLEIPALESKPIPEAAPQPAHRGERTKHPARKRKRRHLMAKLVIGWSIVILAIVFGARRLWPQESEPVKPAMSQAPAKNAVSEEDVILMNKVAPLCDQTFAHFLAAGSPEERSQFVVAPLATVTRMARFDSLNPLASLDPTGLALAGRAMLHLPDRRAVETQWQAAGGRVLDAVFIEENGEWRLDWEHFARFSDYPWALFLSGSGEDHGEFRLLARERLAEERKNSDTISIVLYAPKFGFSNETGYQSPEFLIKRDTRNGRLLDAAFKLERSGGRVFGVPLSSLNPEGMICVRVKVRRVEEDNLRRFELEEVVACHWYSEDAAGVEIPDLPAAIE